jgi:mono/diheme cytochrome c family protein
MKHFLLAFLGGALLSTYVLAGDHGKKSMPANTPPLYLTECGSCHTAFPPVALGASEWRGVMANLSKHYGDNATLDAAPRQQIESFLLENAGDDPAKVGAGEPTKQQGGRAKDVLLAVANDGTARLTQGVWFKRHHREVADSIWRDPKIKSAANCAACHTRAAEGSFREREIVMPNGKRWE